ncbi:hypothetical protein BDW02DRAFT_573230 [Decorospora gaudefroyi]|uniref:Uncharacterized protein n=1 Tax=Decorospora gaudefroyi TaxID=184978 RepID=A0A6A5K2D8_9PLEO|nr:hypothetical protein BDW02DRAFT_573230 [Decorospora gaudefroyi]
MFMRGSGLTRKFIRIPISHDRHSLPLCLNNSSGKKYQLNICFSRPEMNMSAASGTAKKESC